MENPYIKKLISNQDLREAVAWLLISIVLIILTYLVCVVVVRYLPAPERLLKIRRAHWGIETGSRYRRDVTLKEDATRMTIGNAAKVMACLNTLVLALIRQANYYNAAQAWRWFSAPVSQAFSLLTIPFS
jgi:hypothetical protein